MKLSLAKKPQEKRDLSGPIFNAEVAEKQDSKKTSYRNVAWWGPLSGLLILVVLFILPELMATPILYGIYGVLEGGGGYNAFTDWISTTLGNIWYIGITDAVLLGVVGLIAYKKRGTLAGLGLTRPRLKHLGVATLVFLAYIVSYIFIVMVVSQLVPGFDAEQERDIGLNNLAGIRQMMIVFALLVVVTPIVEEIMFRGFLFGGLRKKLPFWAAAIVTSLIFGMAHLSSLGDSAPVWVAALDTGVLSLAMCYAREISKSLWAPIYMHAAKNSIAFVFLYLVQ